METETPPPRHGQVRIARCLTRSSAMTTSSLRFPLFLREITFHSFSPPGTAAGEGGGPAVFRAVENWPFWAILINVICGSPDATLRISQLAEITRLFKLLVMDREGFETSES